MAWIHTFTGKRLDPFDPDPDAIDIVDIAHALSMKCRFTGHTPRFYSVAEHSIGVCERIEDIGASLAGLLHDAAEAYLPDVARPIKGACWFHHSETYRETFDSVEESLLRCIFTRFGVPWPLPEIVHDTDGRMLATEARDLFGATGWPGLKHAPYMRYSVNWKPMTQETAKHLFLQRFHELSGIQRCVI